MTIMNLFLGLQIVITMLTRIDNISSNSFNITFNPKHKINKIVGGMKLAQTGIELLNHFVTDHAQ